MTVTWPTPSSRSTTMDSMTGGLLGKRREMEPGPVKLRISGASDTFAVSQQVIAIVRSLPQ
jgi:hypothetical protein